MGTTVCCNLETLQKYSAEFTDYTKITRLVCQNSVTKQQRLFISKIKEHLNDGEFVVTCDNSENYTFIIQNEAQYYHLPVFMV